MNRQTIGLLTVVSVAAWISILSSVQAADGDRVVTPAAAEEVSVAAQADSTFDPSQHVGKVVYVDFWASWCGPCKQSFPFMKDLVTRFTGQGLDVIGINLDKDRKAAERFLAEAEPNFPSVFDPEGELASQYDLKGMPTTLIFDRNGQLRVTRIGFRDGEGKDLITEIEVLLAEEARSEDHE